MSWLIKLIVGAVLDYFMKLFTKVRGQAKTDAEIDKKTKEQAEALKNAKSDEEFDEAAGNLSSRK